MQTVTGLCVRAQRCVILVVIGVVALWSLPAASGDEQPDKALTADAGVSPKAGARIPSRASSPSDDNAGARIPSRTPSHSDNVPTELGTVMGRALREDYYEPIWQVGTPLAGVDAAWQAPNKSNGFRTYFTDRGPVLTPRSGCDAWRVGFELADGVAPEAKGAVIDYARGNIVERYENTPRGLKQSFILAAPPADSQAGVIELRMAVTGDLSPHAASPDEILLVDSAGVVRLAYRELLSIDANNRPLAGSIDVDSRQIVLRIDAADAAYPVVVDPYIVTLEQQLGNLLALSDAESNAFLGNAVALSGDTAVIGASADDGAAGFYQGSAYVFVRSGTVWSQQAKLLAADAAEVDRFGESVAISEDTAVIGAHGDSSPGGTSQGSAYVFVRSGSVWSQQTKLLASDAATSDGFGISVAISGDTALIGAVYDDGAAGNDQGSAYVFVRSGAVWSQQAKLLASDAAAHDYFGFSVAYAGDTALIGAHLHDGAAGVDQGSVYVFVRSGAVWNQQAQILASDAAASDYFGYSVAISGDTAAIGAVLCDGASGSAQGAAYVFVRSGSVWSEQAKLLASDGASGDAFGISIAISGDTTVIGAWQDSDAAGFGQGSAYVFVRSGTVWSQQAKLLASDAAASDRFGSSVAISANTTVIGASGDDGAAGHDQGSAYVFVRSGATWSQQAKLGASDGDFFASLGLGNSVSISGDTVVVSSNLEDGPAGAWQGAAYVFVRSGTAWSQQAKLLASDGAADDQFGFSVAIFSDTAVVGALRGDGAAGEQGAAYVFVRSGGVWSQQAKLLASDGVVHDQFGYSVTLSGDTAVVGANVADGPSGYQQGSAYVFVRSGTVWSQQAKLLASDAAAADQFGQSVAVSGDTAVISAIFDDGAAGNEQGSAYVFVRSGTSWSEQAKLLASDAVANDRFGNSVTVSGDTAVIGASMDDATAGVDQGSAYVFVRSGTTWSQQAKLLASDAAASDVFGSSVSISGDTTVIGAYGDDGAAGSAQGSAYVFVRSGVSWSQQAKLIASDAAFIDSLGRSVAISGDTAVICAPGKQGASASNPGCAYVFVRSGTVWGEQAKLAALKGDLSEADSFGYSVALSGDTAVIGAPHDSGAGGEGQGSAYVFVRTGTSWGLQAKLVASDAVAAAQFGNSVAVSGGFVVIGAALDVGASGNEQGSAYVFVRSGTVWTQQVKLLASDAMATDQFGVSVAISGNTALIGANRDDGVAGSDQGSAYVFVRTGTAWTQQAHLFASDAAAGDNFAYSVALFGNTAIIGATTDDDAAGTNQGSAYVFVRSGTVWSQQAKLLASDADASDSFGISVAASGETALIGAYTADDTAGVDQGCAYVFVRSGTTWSQQAKLLASDAAAQDLFGVSVAISGETAVVGASQDGGPAGVNQGSVHVFTRSGTTWSPRAKLTALDAGANDEFGRSVAISGDTTLVGAYRAGYPGINGAGKAYVYRLLDCPLPSISQPPVGATLCAGAALNLSAVASGSPAPMYQWRKDGFDILSATSASYSVASAAAADAGAYTVVVSNTCGSVESAPAVVVVITTCDDGDPCTTDTCSGGVCLHVRICGACCHPDGSCSDNEFVGGCATGGVYQGDNTVCTSVSCPQPAVACCFADGHCDELTATDCQTAGGAAQGYPSGCILNLCPQPAVACCYDDGHCLEITAYSCGLSGGHPQGNPSSCSPNLCPQPGACCTGCSCVLAQPGDCAGLFLGAGSSCAGSACGLRGDANCDHMVNNFDIDPFVLGLLGNLPGYLALGGTTVACYDLRSCWGDVGCDAAFNNFDIDPFVGCLLNPPDTGFACPCAP